MPIVNVKNAALWIRDVSKEADANGVVHTYITERRFGMVDNLTIDPATAPDPPPFPKLPPMEWSGTLEMPPGALDALFDALYPTDEN